MLEIGIGALRPNPPSTMQDDLDSAERPLRLPFVPLLIAILLAVVWVSAQPRHEPWSHHHRWSQHAQCPHHARWSRHGQWAPADRRPVPAVGIDVAAERPPY